MESIDRLAWRVDKENFLRHASLNPSRDLCGHLTERFLLSKIF